jgi:hypothetical protein
MFRRLVGKILLPADLECAQVAAALKPRVPEEAVEVEADVEARDDEPVVAARSCCASVSRLGIWSWSWS